MAAQDWKRIMNQLIEMMGWDSEVFCFSLMPHQFCSTLKGASR